MSSLYRKDGWWYYSYSLGGKRRYKALRTKDETTAKRAQKVLDGQLEHRRLGLTPARCQVAQGLADYMASREAVVTPRTMERYGSQVRRITSWMADEGVEYWHNLTADHASAWVRDMTREGLAPKTIDDTLTLLRSVLRWLWKTGRISEIPVREWPAIRTRAAHPDRLGCYSAQEVQALIEHFRFREFGPTLTFGAYTGARREEIRLARVADVDLAQGVVRLRNHKTEQDAGDAFRAIPVSPNLRPLLEERTRGRRPDDLLFPELGAHSPSWPHEQMRAGCKALGIQYRRFHGLRHTFGSHYLKASGDPRGTMEVMGHRDLKTLRRYSHVVGAAVDPKKLGY